MGLWSSDNSVNDGYSPLEELLLTRNHQVFVKPGQPASDAQQTQLIKAFESELLNLGFVVSAELYQSLEKCSEKELKRLHKNVLKQLAAEVGADKKWRPLFVSFPEGITENTTELYFKRLITHLYAMPDHPCLLCARSGTLKIVKPCGHLVCDQCFKPEDYNGCPICNKSVEPGSLYAPKAIVEPGEPGVVTTVCGPTDLIQLTLCESPDAEAAALFEQFLSRKVVLSPDDASDLTVIIKAFQGRSVQYLLDHIPKQIPVRENIAMVFGWLARLADSRQSEHWFPAFAKHANTATDVLRFAALYSGGDPALIEPVQSFRSMPRRLRRQLLSHLNQLNPVYLCEDFGRYPGAWKRLTRKLHIYEGAKKIPQLALATAVLRETNLKPYSELSQIVLSEAKKLADHVRIKTSDHGNRVQFLSWSYKVEKALESSDVDSLVSLLGQRPGELSRRLDHALRVCGAETAEVEAPGRLLSVFNQRVEKMATPILLTLAEHLKGRDKKAAKRVFFPKGEVLHSWASKDERSLLDRRWIDALVTTIQAELIRRFEQKSKLDFAVIDSALQKLVVPFNQRTQSSSLIALPRGSKIDIPDKPILRIFVHWMQESFDVDLDLSAVCYTDSWGFVGGCDFTGLRFGEGAAVHSGDFTSAPEPDGACEFIDLDIEKFKASGVRYVVMNIFSYNNVPFDRLVEGFAGFMARDRSEIERNKYGLAYFDARTVRQRFDLRGRAKVAIPLYVDLKLRQMFWLDALMTVDGDHHQIARHSAGIGAMCSDFEQYFGAGTRPMMFELSLLQAAARCKNVYLRTEDQAVLRFTKAESESATDFYRRLKQVSSPDTVELTNEFLAGPGLYCLVRGENLSIEDSSEVYCLDPRGINLTDCTRLGAADLLS